MEEPFKNWPILKWISIGIYMMLWFGGILALIVFTSDGSVELTWIVIGVLVVSFVYNLGHLNGWKELRGYLSEDFLNAKWYFEDEDTTIFPVTKKKATGPMKDLIDSQYKDAKKGLYLLITVFAIYLLLAWSGLWRHLLNWLSELFGVRFF
tara:strand:- start:168 stop:620 length:453 start_codon:yes stop_codon:yes gene_type:complete